MEGSGDQLFRDITNGNNNHSLRPRTPEGKTALSKRKSKEDPHMAGPTVEGGQKRKSRGRPRTESRPRTKRVRQQVVERLGRNVLQNLLPAVPAQQIGGVDGQGNNLPLEQVQGGGGGTASEIKTEYGEEPRIVIVDEDEEKEEEDQIDKALRELRLLQKRRERIEMIAQEQQRRLQKFAEKEIVLKEKLAGLMKAAGLL